MNRAALFFDIDGTVLSEITKEIPASTVDALKRAHDAGHFLFINTGRTYCSVPVELKKLPFDGYLCGCINPDCTISLERSRKSKAESIEKWNAKMKRESHGNAWHPCQYVDCKLEHDGSWIDGKWYEWEDVHGNREVARMKLDAIDHFYPHAKIIKEEGVCRYRELEEGEDNADH